jgi:phytoene/squalene synthetase
MAIGFLFGVAFESSYGPRIVQQAVTATNTSAHLLDSYAYAVSDTVTSEKMKKVTTKEEWIALINEYVRRACNHAASARREAEELKTKSVIHRVPLDLIIESTRETERRLGGCS